jgi:hypothetical protein
VLLASPHALAPAAQPWWLQAPNTPERFGAGTLSTDAEESALNLAPDGGRLYFARSRLWFPASRIAAIWVAERGPNGIAEPVPAAFSRGFSDVDPFVLRDGSAVVFSSMRPVEGRPRKDFDLWQVRVLPGGGFGPAENLGPQVNSADDDLFASVSADGTLYFGSERAGGQGGWDLWFARRGDDGRWGAAQNLGPPVNSGGWEFNPAIAPDGSFLVFTGFNRAGGAGLGDLWISRRGADGRFGEPRPLVGVNTAAEEYHPSLSPDGRTLFFIRRDAARGIAADFYWVSLAAVLPAP